MVNLPSGTVTFVFSDIEGSTRLLKELGDTEYATLLAVHRRLVRDIFTAHEGQEIDTQGDAFFYSFVRARQAVAAAVEVTRAHVKASWPRELQVRVRLGLHTGEPAVGDEGYTGIDVVRASRIAATGVGGQVLLSETTRSIVAGDIADGVVLRPVGDRKLKDIDRPEPLWELLIDEDTAATPDGDAPDDGPPAKTAEAEVEAEGEPRPSALRELAGKTRQQIEARVLAQLEETLGSGFPFTSPSPPPPPKPPAGLATTEIKRLHKLREAGALTDEQYQRAVDRLLDGDD